MNYRAFIVGKDGRFNSSETIVARTTTCRRLGSRRSWSMVMMSSWQLDRMIGALRPKDLLTPK